jgi:chromosome segregation ATPase
MRYQAALDAMGKMTRVLKAFEDADVVLQALAGVEQNEKELRAAVEKNRSEQAASAAELVETKESLALAKKAAAKVKDDAQVKADQIVAEAQAKAAAVEQRIAEARVEAATELDATMKAIDKARADHADAVAKLAEMETKIDKARSQIAKLLG